MKLRTIVGLAVTLIVCVFLLSTCGLVNVHPTEVAVKTNKLAGSIDPAPLGVGYHLYNRIKTHLQIYTVSARSFPGDVRKSEDSELYTLGLKTKDGQNVQVDLTIIYLLASKDVPRLHQEVGKNYEDQVLLPQIRSEARIVIGGFSAEELYQGEIRDTIQQGIRDKLARALSKYPAIQVQDALIRSFKFDPEYEKKIQEKKLAVQQLEINRNLATAELENAKKIEAAALGEKLKVIKQAEGRADSAKIEADANRYKLEQEAKGQLALLKSQAEGARLQALALAGKGGENVVALRFAEKLAPTLETITVPVGNNTTSVLGLPGLTNGLFSRSFTSDKAVVAPASEPVEEK